MSEYRQEFPRRFFQLLDIITAADPRPSYHSEDREWLLQSMLHGQKSKIGEVFAQI